jgi:hypothetical protein
MGNKLCSQPLNHEKKVGSLPMAVGPNGSSTPH